MQFTLTITGLDAARRSYDSAHVKKASRMSINEAVKAARVTASEKIRQKWNIKKADLDRKMLQIFKLARNADLEAVLQAKGRPIGLSYFGIREVKAIRGTRKVWGTRNGRRVQRSDKRAGTVTVRLLKGQPATVIKGGFTAQYKSGRVGVWQRVGKGKWGKFQGAKERNTVTVASMFNQENVIRAVERRADEVLQRRFWHHLQREMTGPG